VIEALLLFSIVALIVGAAALVVANFALQRARRAIELVETHIPSRPSIGPLELLGEERRRLERQLGREHQEYLEASQSVGHSDEGQQEKEETSELDRQRLFERLDQLLQGHSETLEHADQQEQQGVQLEQERQRLIEELEQCRKGYLEAQQQVEQLKQECLEAQRGGEQLQQVRLEDQRKAEQLAQERERSHLEQEELLRKLRDISEGLGGTGGFGRRRSDQGTPEGM
jgi:chromosome segregation ATPase